MPRNYLDGGLIVGDSGSFLDSQRLKGIHLAIKSGMRAAETILEALKAGDTSSKTLSAFPNKIEQNYINKELWQVRNFHESFHHRMLSALFHITVPHITDSLLPIDVPCPRAPYYT